MLKITLLCSLFFVSFHSNAQYNLVWSDEFNGSALNPFFWIYETGNGCPNLCGWGNNELQNYTSNPANIAVDSGYLRISAVDQSANYTSARIKTQGRYDVQYGKIEARMKVPIGKGLWPAFWMLGSNISSVGWPQCGEIDIMEHVNVSPYVNGTIHHNDWAGSYTYNGGNVLCDVTQFQVYGIEWSTDSLTWTLNGVPYHQIHIENGTGSTEEFHAPFFLLFNLAVGGNWPGAPDGTTVFPADMLIDYVRVYQNTTNIEVIESAAVLLYPNPVIDVLHVEADAKFRRYSIVTLDGKMLRSDIDIQANTISVEDLNIGLYFIVFEDEKGNLYQHKFTKK